MNLLMNYNLVEKYHSNSQKARILTEDWVKNNCYCPVCGNSLEHFPNNKPVADFYCNNCNEIYELKSKNGNLSNTINDGAYQTMIERITSNTNPNFFFLVYDAKKYMVNNFLFISKYFFTPKIIIKRKPLSNTARRAGWVGCNINLKTIPSSGKIFIIKENIEIPQNIVLDKVNKNLALKENNIKIRGWILDVLFCIEKVNKEIFSLNDMYKFENYLYNLHPNNNNIRPKIRQQLQILRDKGYVEFLGNGLYKKTI